MRKTQRLLALLLALIMVLGAFPAVAFATVESQILKIAAPETEVLEGMPTEHALPVSIPIGHVTLAVESFTVNQGYLLEPILVPFYEGDRVGNLVSRALGTGNFINGAWSQNPGVDRPGTAGENITYLARVRDPHVGNDFPPHIITNPNLGARRVAGWIGEFDYLGTSGFLWTQNNVAPAGMGTAIPANNGVIRIRFQLFNGDGSMHGVGGGVNRDALTRQMGFVNHRAELLAIPAVQTAYDNARIVIADLTSTQADLDNAMAALRAAMPQNADLSITYNLNGGVGGEIVDGNLYMEGDVVQLLPIRGVHHPADLDFIYWNTKADGTGITHRPGGLLAFGEEDIVLYAQWDRAHTITYDMNAANGGGTIATSLLHTVLPGQTVSLRNVAVNSTTDGRLPGSVFTGWNTEADGSGTQFAGARIITMPRHDLTLYANWATGFRITYHLNGGAGNTPAATALMAPGASINLNNTAFFMDTSRRIAEWNTEADGSGDAFAPGSALIMPAHDVTLYAIYRQAFRITYDGNGRTGGGAVPAPTAWLLPGVSLTLNASSGANALLRNSQRIVAWNTEPDGSGERFALNSAFIMRDYDLTLYAEYEDAFTLAFNNNGGTGTLPAHNPALTFPGTVVMLGNASTMLTTAAGGRIVGWNTAADGSGDSFPLGYAFTMPEANITMYAVYEQAFQLTYNGNGNTGGLVPQVWNRTFPGDSITIAAFPQPWNVLVNAAGQRVYRWDTEPDGSGDSFAFGQVISMPAHDLTLFAIYTAGFRVSYNLNGGTGNTPAASDLFLEGGTLTLNNTVFWRNGTQLIIGWNTEADGSGDFFGRGTQFTMPAHNVTLYAVYQDAFTVIYNTNGGSAAPASPARVLAGGDVGVTTVVPTRAGVTFRAWNTEQDGSGMDYRGLDRFRLDDSDVTLYARWSANRVLYDANGGTGTVPVDTTLYTPDQELIALAASDLIAPTGLDFIEWNTRADGTGTSVLPSETIRIARGDLTLYAIWNNATTTDAEDAVAVLEAHSFAPVVQPWTTNAATSRNAAIDAVRAQVNALLAGLDVTATVPAPGTGVSDFPNPPLNFGAPPTNRTFTVNLVGDDGSTASTTIVVNITFPAPSPGPEVAAAVTALVGHTFAPVDQAWIAGNTAAQNRTAGLNAVIAQINAAFDAAGVTGVTAALPATINELPTLTGAGLPAADRSLTVNLTGPSSTFGSVRITVNMVFQPAPATGITITTAPLTGRTTMIADSSLQFNAAVLPAGVPQGVVWSVSGHANAAIDATTGLLTVGNVPVDTVLTITATTTDVMGADGLSVSNTATITVVEASIVYVSIEAFTIGEGFIVEPTPVRIPAAGVVVNRNAMLALHAVLEGTPYSALGTGIAPATGNFTRLGGFVTGSITPPEFMLGPIATTPGNFSATNYNPVGLGANDFGFPFISGWMFTVNDRFPGIDPDTGLGMGLAGNTAILNDGDVVRWQFSLVGSSDIGMHMSGFAPPFYRSADKSDLVRALLESANAPIEPAARTFALGAILNPMASEALITSAIAWIVDGTAPNLTPMPDGIGLNRTAWNNATRGQSQTFAAQVFDQFGNLYPNQSVTWSLVPDIWPTSATANLAGGAVAEVHANTIVANGVVTVYAEQRGGSMTLRAASAADPTVSSARASVATARPVIGITAANQPVLNITVTQGAITGNLNVTATATLNATRSYQWYLNTTLSNTGGTAIPNATSASFAIPTDLTPGDHFFYVVVSATLGANPLASRAVTVTVEPGAATPVITITEQPASTTVTQGAITGNLSVTATVTESATLSYQWYQGGTAIPNATSATLAIPTDLTVGTHDFHVVVRATGGAAAVTSSTATVTVNSSTPPISFVQAKLDVLGWLRAHITDPGVVDEWAVLALARAEIDDEDWYALYLANLETALGLGNEITTLLDFARVTLAVTSLGEDATAFGSGNLDLTEAFRTFTPSAATINAHIFSLIALDSNQYPSTDRQLFIHAILDAQNAGGSWSLTVGGSPDLDITAMALQALAPYYDSGNARLDDAVTAARAWLSQQTVSDAEGHAQIIVALSALGYDAIDHVTDILTFRDAATGAFTRDGAVNAMTTEQAAYALVAYWRFLEGMNSLYDMRDANDPGTGVIPVNRVALNSEIVRAAERVESNYTDESWRAMQLALTAAIAVRDNANATQLQVDTARDNLHAAINVLVPIQTGAPARGHISVRDPNAGPGQTAVFFSGQWFDLEPNETAYSLLRRTGLNIVSRGTALHGRYVVSINGWGEFSDGPHSGWMVRVNGVFPTVSASLVELRNGDVVEWLFTRNLGDDLGGGSGTGGGGGFLPPEEDEDEDDEIDGGTEEHPFTDLSRPDAWYAEAVQFMFEQGLMEGVSPTRFDPQGTLTRAQVVTILYRLADEPAVTFRSVFSDVPANAPAWYRNAVIWAYDNEIVLGVGEGRFDPNGEITREQFAAMLHRYAEFIGASTIISSWFNLDHFPDRDQLSTWAESYKYWANYNELILGMAVDNQTLLVPGGNTTRAQCATILMRFVQTFID